MAESTIHRVVNLKIERMELSGKTFDVFMGETIKPVVYCVNAYCYEKKEGENLALPPDMYVIKSQLTNVCSIRSYLESLYEILDQDAKSRKEADNGPVNVAKMTIKEKIKPQLAELFYFLKVNLLAARDEKIDTEDDTPSTETDFVVVKKTEGTIDSTKPDFKETNEAETEGTEADFVDTNEEPEDNETSDSSDEGDATEPPFVVVEKAKRSETDFMETNEVETEGTEADFVDTNEEPEDNETSDSADEGNATEPPFMVVEKVKRTEPDFMETNEVETEGPEPDDVDEEPEDNKTSDSDSSSDEN